MRRAVYQRGGMTVACTALYILDENALFPTHHPCIAPHTRPTHTQTYERCITCTRYPLHSPRTDGAEAHNRTRAGVTTTTVMCTLTDAVDGKHGARCCAQRRRAHTSRSRRHCPKKCAHHEKVELAMMMKSPMANAIMSTISPLQRAPCVVSTASPCVCMGVIDGQEQQLHCQHFINLFYVSFHNSMQSFSG